MSKKNREIFPKFSKNRVDKAGRNIRKKISTQEDIDVIENWRASHTHILNTFQATLRNLAKNKNVVVAQRLKRRSTIFDKLTRQNGMSLARMHDIAGCRLIFKDISSLNDFRLAFQKLQFKHIRKNKETDYDYILNPKNSGYRSIHDVYVYKAKTPAGEKWNDLLLEIQYRTNQQHAWATAVEIAGSLTTNQPKFDRGEESHKEFFRLASEIIARAHENQKSCYPESSNRDLRQGFLAIEKKTQLLRTLKGLTKVNSEILTKPGEKTQNIILVFSPNKDLETYTYRTSQEAVEKYFELEKNATLDQDIVLVRADSNEYIKNAFRNYFSDAADFTYFVEQGLKFLKNNP